MKIDIYDFDKTLVPYDSAMKFYTWSLVHYPQTLIVLPFQIVWGTLAATKIISINTFKKYCFNFVRLFNTKKAVKKFWDSHIEDVYPFIKKENRASNNKVVLISASPDFLIEEIASRLDIDYCIASIHNDKNGQLINKVCRKEEKVRRFNDLNLDAEVENVFSDNIKADRPIFELGQHCYLVTKGTLKEINL